MPPQTFKRQAEEKRIFNNDALDDDEYDVTWGGQKKSRYLYTYTLQSPDLFSNINDSDQTESVYSIQSKSTIDIADQHFSSELSSCECDSNCDCETSVQSDLTENEVIKNIILHESDNGYKPDDTDTENTISKVHKHFPAFKTCSLCKRENPDSYYQYCYECFRYRMQMYDSKPDPKPKSIKLFLNKMSNKTEENGSNKNSQDSCVSNSQESGSFGISSLYLSQESLINTTLKTIVDSCNICFLKPKDGIFNHGKTAHVYSCYSCSKQIWSKSGKCPICNLKVRYVTKAITA